MEFPDLGQHCSNSSCKQLDFLPMKCDACDKTYCKDHIQYDAHGCPESYRKNNQVPVCPLCNTPCPLKKGEAPDMVIERHIGNDCQSDSAKQRRKIYTNKCSVKTCKQKELIPVHCDKCLKNFCIRHRNELDHDCQGYENTGRQVSRAGAAALSRNHAQPSASSSRSAPTIASHRPPQQQALFGLGKQFDQDRRSRQAGTSSSRSHTDIMPGHMTEDEALRLAMQASMNNSPPQPASNTEMTQQEQEDLMLARALAASEEEARQHAARRPTTSRQEKSTCHLS